MYPETRTRLSASRPGQTGAGARECAVVVCGSFKRDLSGLAADIASFRDDGCEVLSPARVDFVAEEDGFVFLAEEVDSSPAEIEAGHLAALRRADLVWLHAPDGYVGASGAFEIGVAHMAGLPVFGRELPHDPTLRHFVRQTRSPSAAIEEAQRSPFGPGAPLEALQSYYARVAARRGWDGESAAECMLLLTEEVGELARAIRKSVGLARDASAGRDDPAEELADVQLYVVHLANVIGVDLAAAVTEKERENARRVRLRAAAA